MSSRQVNVVLLALTLGLLGTIGYLIYLLQSPPLPLRGAIPPQAVTNTVTQIAVRKVFPTNFFANLGKVPISWRAVESTNYQVYIANLKAIECPAETIRDIIIADVAKLYARRRAAVRARGQPYRFWQTGDAWENGPAADPAIRKQLQGLDAEERALVKHLLGVDLATELAKFGNGDEEQERMYGFLSPEKRQQVLDLQARFDALEQEVYANSKGVMLDEDQEQLKAIQKQKEAELAAFLSPDELEEYQLRNSPTANGLRSQLTGFEPSEEEFRKIFKLQKTFDDEFSQAFDSTDDRQLEIKARAQQEAQDALNAEVKKALGPARYNEWVRAQDGDYRTLSQVAERFELPQETTAKVYDMKQEAEKQKQKIEGNPNLTEDQRNNALAAIARETERSVAAAMGGNVFRAYQKAGAQWLQNLGISSVPPEPIVIAPEPQVPLVPPPPPGFPGVVPPPPPKQ